MRHVMNNQWLIIFFLYSMNCYGWQWPFQVQSVYSTFMDIYDEYFTSDMHIQATDEVHVVKPIADGEIIFYSTYQYDTPRMHEGLIIISHDIDDTQLYSWYASNERYVRPLHYEVSQDTILFPLDEKKSMYMGIYDDELQSIVNPQMVLPGLSDTVWDNYWTIIDENAHMRFMNSGTIVFDTETQKKQQLQSVMKIIAHNDMQPLWKMHSAPWLLELSLEINNVVVGHMSYEMLFITEHTLYNRFQIPAFFLKNWQWNVENIFLLSGENIVLFRQRDKNSIWHTYQYIIEVGV